jgi:hypothetical protein
VGPPDSHGIPRAPRYSGTPLAGRSAFVYRAVTFCGGPFQEPSTSCRLCHCVTRPPPRPVGPTTPAQKRRWAITLCGFRLVPVRSPLLRESRLLSLPRRTEMFQFGRFPPQALCVQTWVTGHDPGRVSPFGHPRINAFLAAPRGFSQPDASFIGSWRLGIHREPFITWTRRCSRSLLSSQGPDTNAREERSAPARRFVSGLAPSGPNSVPDRRLRSDHLAFHSLPREGVLAEADPSGLPIE